MIEIYFLFYILSAYFCMSISYKYVNVIVIIAFMLHMYILKLSDKRNKNANLSK